MLMEILKDTKEKLIVNDLEHSRVEQLKGVSTSGAKAIHSPFKVRSRGHPTTKRKQSKIEQIVKKSVAKARKKDSRDSRVKVYFELNVSELKVKMKLTTLGHAQSEETRAKIGAGVREGWRRRQQRLSVQDGCFFEWKNIIAESARKGSAGEYKLQWDSFHTQERQLKLEWLESIEKRKQMPKPKGNNRAPKSLEHRRKISEAILAKWND
ncbi:hypothetical protein ZIOFF_050364 [Zingiber officinale]|uniref:Nuclease associated modular domain-containing protein n=1 Tax=Zingiber officinale TaxID=94328 RepID=A0A8J5KLW9_ZINOF|nr:hypothetical protein ZIOFF_050364 [Zingiber officinale]